MSGVDEQQGTFTQLGSVLQWRAAQEGQHRAGAGGAAICPLHGALRASRVLLHCSGCVCQHLYAVVSFADGVARAG